MMMRSGICGHLNKNPVWFDIRERSALKDDRLCTLVWVHALVWRGLLAVADERDNTEPLVRPDKRDPSSDAVSLDANDAICLLSVVKSRCG
jgi:hypothetical protein